MSWRKRARFYTARFRQRYKCVTFASPLATLRRLSVVNMSKLRVRDHKQQHLSLIF